MCCGEQNVDSQLGSLICPWSSMSLLMDAFCADHWITSPSNILSILYYLN